MLGAIERPGGVEKGSVKMHCECYAEPPVVEKNRLDIVARKIVDLIPRSADRDTKIAYANEFIDQYRERLSGCKPSEQGTYLVNPRTRIYLGDKVYALIDGCKRA